MTTEMPTEPDVAGLGSISEAAISRRQMNVVFATVVVAMLLSALDQTIVSTALPTIVGDLGGGHLSWVVSAYLLTDTISTVLAGRLSDQFGRKRILQISAAVFIVSSAMCGFASGMTWLIAWRGIQGLGAGGLGVTASAVIADVIPLRDRAKYQGALGSVFGVALVLGPLLGGFFTDDLSWRWVFLINLPLGLLVMALAQRTIPKISLDSKPTVDYSGIAFVSIGAAAITLALSWGGTSYGWGSPTIIGLFVGAAVAFATFVRIEARAAEPMLPLHLFRDPVFSVSVALALIVGFAMLGALTFLPTYSQYVKGISPTSSGVRTLPLVAGLLGTSMLAGTVVSKTGRYKIFPIVGSLVMALGLFMFSRLTPGSSYLSLAVDMLVFGAGTGLSMQVLTIIVQNTVDFRDLGVATSGVSFFRTLGSSFGTAIFGTIFTTTLTPVLTKALIHEPGVNPKVVDSPKALHAYPAHAIAPILSAYSHGLHVLFLSAVPVALAAFLLALFLPQRRMRQTALAGVTDVGAGFSAPSSPDRQTQLEQAISRVLRAAGPDDRVAVAQAAHTNLDAATLWCVGVIAARTRMQLETSLLAIARRHRVPVAVLKPAFDTSRQSGYLSGIDDQLVVTDAGRAELDRLATAIRTWIASKLEDWDAAQEPGFDEALKQVARGLIAA